MLGRTAPLLIAVRGMAIVPTSKGCDGQRRVALRPRSSDNPHCIVTTAKMTSGFGDSKWHRKQTSVPLISIMGPSRAGWLASSRGSQWSTGRSDVLCLGESIVSSESQTSRLHGHRNLEMSIVWLVCAAGRHAAWASVYELRWRQDGKELRGPPAQDVH